MYSGQRLKGLHLFQPVELSGKKVCKAHAHQKHIIHIFPMLTIPKIKEGKKDDLQTDSFLPSDCFLVRQCGSRAHWVAYKKGINMS